jgi:hypothetical protein
VLTDNVFEFGGDLIDSLIPGDALKTISNTLEGILKAVGIMLVIGNVHALTAEIALTSGVGFIRLHLDDAVIFHLDCKPAVLGTENTSGFMYCFHESSFLP